MGRDREDWPAFAKAVRLELYRRMRGSDCKGCSEASRVIDGLRAVLKSEQPYFVDTYACPFNGRYHWYQVQISAFDLNNMRHAILMHVDVSVLQRDSLTGLANRAMFDAQLDLALSLAREHGRRTGVVIVELTE